MTDDPPHLHPTDEALEKLIDLFFLELESLRRLPEAVFGVLMSLEPALAALAGFVVLGQDLRARELAAIVLVVAASAGAARGASSTMVSG